MPSSANRIPQHESTATPLLGSASWIWVKHASGPDQYACFRKSFTLSDILGQSYLEISSDSDFVAFVNGHEIGRGQFSDFPRTKTFSKFHISDELLICGRNLLAVLVFHKGDDFSDYSMGHPGMIASMHSESYQIITDETWRGSLHSCFRSGYAERVTYQMGFTFQYDSKRWQNWKSTEFDDSGWALVEIVQHRALGSFWSELSPRPLPNLILSEISPALILNQGTLLHRRHSESAAENMYNVFRRFEFASTVFEESSGIEIAYQGATINPGSLLDECSPSSLTILPAGDGYSGRFFILDLGLETVGLLEFELETTSGMILEIAHGEHVTDGRVRMLVGGRHFADRYICRQGRQKFQMPFRRLGARYIEIHICGNAPVKLYYFGLRRVDYPTCVAGAFLSPDLFTNRLHEISVRTLGLCRHEHYEDTPWREQSLYAYDARLQALYGYYSFGDYLFPEVSFRLLGETITEKGILGLVAPGNCSITIPVFSFVWIVSIAENWLFSGNPRFFEEVESSIDQILNRVFDRRDPGTGLFWPPEGPEFWHFYEWSSGLAGPLGNDDLRGAHHAAYNLHLLEAIRHGARMYRWSDKVEKARELEAIQEELKKAISTHFWNPKGFFSSNRTADGQLSGKHVLVQALALGENLLSSLNRKLLINAIASNELIPATLSSSYYVAKLISTSSVLGDWFLHRCETAWARMIFSGASTVWETEAGSEDFDQGGSLCHGWSALPIYIHQACFLGIRPLEPGFLKFDIQIFPWRHDSASGVVPTPHGPINVDWRKCLKGLTVTISGPNVCHPSYTEDLEVPVSSITYNGTAIDAARIS